MQYIKGDIWHLRAGEWIVVPLGTDHAKIAAHLYPELPKLRSEHDKMFPGRIFVDCPFVLFPVQSELRLIENACHELRDLDRMLRSVDHNPTFFLPPLAEGLYWEREVRPVVDSILEGDQFVLVEKDG